MRGRYSDGSKYKDVADHEDAVIMRVALTAATAVIAVMGVVIGAWARGKGLL